MTALNFPTSPADGDTFDNYIYDGVREVWRLQPNIPGISSRFKVSATAPENPANGEIWLNSTDGNTYIYYADVDSAQWIEIGGTTGNPPDLDSLNDVTITSPTTDQLLRWNGTAWVNGTANTNSIADGAVTATKLANTAGAVMVFDDATARATAIPTPVEGMVTYLKDEDEVTVFDGSAFKAVGPGKILQVVSDTTNTATTTASTTFQNTSLTATITPSSTSSKVLVFAQFQDVRQSNSGGETNVTIFRGTVAGTKLDCDVAIYFDRNGTNLMGQTLLVVDTPSTTSAQAYTVGIKSDNASNTASVQRRQNIVLMEVAG